MVVFMWFLLDLVIEFCEFGWWVFYIFLMNLIPFAICKAISDGKKLPHPRAILGLFAGLLVAILMGLFMMWCEFGIEGIKDILSNLGDYLIFFDFSD
jgi:hypothetical protein